jgi:hypothetical protein
VKETGVRKENHQPVTSDFGFREEDFLEINQSETRIACGSHVC